LTSAGAVYEVLWTETALEMLRKTDDRRVQQVLYDTSKRLATDPEKQGKPLRAGLLGFRSLRALGQRYRLIYSVSTDRKQVFVVAAGMRRADSRDDIYALAERLLRLGLVRGSGTSGKSRGPRAAPLPLKSLDKGKRKHKRGKKPRL